MFVGRFFDHSQHFAFWLFGCCVSASPLGRNIITCHINPPLTSSSQEDRLSLLHHGFVFPLLCWSSVLFAGCWACFLRPASAGKIDLFSNYYRLEGSRTNYNVRPVAHFYTELLRTDGSLITVVYLQLSTYAFYFLRPLEEKIHRFTALQ